MAENLYTDINRRHDFVILFDVVDGNPNGDPDAGNLPRVDPETMHGLVTDVCLKRKVRDWIDAACGANERMKIYVQHGAVLNQQHERAYTALKRKSTGSKQDRDTVKEVRRWMCENFFDIRLFGAVMTTNINCGQVRGPVQLTFARSIDPVVPLDISITRVAITRSEDAQTNEAGEGGKNTEMGRKSIVPYGLYRAQGFFVPSFAKDTGVTADDLAVFWQALQQMWDLDRSAARGMMACRGLYIFSHHNALGNAPAHKLFDLISVCRCDGVKAPRHFADYAIEVNEVDIPEGVTLTKLV